MTLSAQRASWLSTWGLTVWCALMAVLGLGLAFVPWLVRCASALTVLATLTGQHTIDPLVERLLEPITITNLPAVRIGEREIRARRYAPRLAKAQRPGVLLLHGVHPRGIDERHLVAFARTLAAGGLDVLTPELPDLLAYRLDSGTIAQIRTLAQLHASQTATAAVGAIGISFAGGLALMAAAEQAADRPIGFVVAVGAHADLLRLCRYYAGEDVRGPEGEPVAVAPHPYGARVMIREHLPRFFAGDDALLAQRALDAYLHDQNALAQRLSQRLSPAGQRVMAILLDARQRESLAPLLSAVVDSVRPQLLAASPHGHLARLQVPVFLVHGADDPVIPSIETRFLTREVPRPWLRQSLITPLLRHTEFPAPPKLGETWELVRFLKGIYEVAGSCARPVPSRH